MSKHPSRVVVAAAVAALGGLGLGLLVARTGQRSPRAPASVEEAEGASTGRADDGDVAALRRRLAKLEGESAARGQAAGQGLNDEATKVAEAAARTQLQEKVKKYYTPALEAKRFTDYFAGLDRARHAEGVDPVWAATVQATVARTLAGTGSIATLAMRSVECGRTLCRMEVDAKDEGVKAAAIGELLQGVGGELPTASVHVPVGGGPVVAYLARQGTELPAMQTAEALVAELP